MLRKLLIVLVLAVVTGAALVERSEAQLAVFDHQVEIHGFGGYVWSSSQSYASPQPPNGIGSGDLDFKSSPWWGIAVDINLPQGAMVELLYTRQDTDLTNKPNGIGPTETLTGAAVEFYHVGGVYHRYSTGKVFPFTSFTLGGTRYVLDGARDDTWKFSVTLGLGAKIHVNERLGIRAQARLPWTFTNMGAGLGFGTGGVSLGVGGSGIVGFDLSGGLFLML